MLLVLYFFAALLQRSYYPNLALALSQIAAANPYVWGATGAGLAVGFSIFGAAWGIFTAGSSIAGASIRAPHIRSKNLISVIFCEAVAIYGVIVAIVHTSKMELRENSLTDAMSSSSAMSPQTTASGYMLFCSGLTVGLGNLACGIAVGILGSACAIADAANPALFVHVLVMEIFASAFGIFALIIGILQAQHAKFK